MLIFFLVVNPNKFKYALYIISLRCNPKNIKGVESSNYGFFWHVYCLERAKHTNVTNVKLIIIVCHFL